MSPTIKVSIAHKRHHYSAVEGWIQDFAEQLANRWIDIAPDLRIAAELHVQRTEKALKPSALLDAMFLSQLENLVTGYTEQTTESIARNIRAAHLFGVEVARSGEQALTQPPDASQIMELASTPRQVDNDAADYLQARAFAHVQDLDNDLVGEFRRLLIDGTYNRQSPQQVAQQFANGLGDYSPRWSTIARTEMADALSHGSIQQTRAIGKHHIYFPVVPGCCGDCQRLVDGKVFPVSAIEGKSNRGKKKDAWGPASQVHPNCVHHPIPASAWLVSQAEERAGGTVPPTGVYVPYTPPAQR